METWRSPLSISLLFRSIRRTKVCLEDTVKLSWVSDRSLAGREHFSSNHLDEFSSPSGSPNLRTRPLNPSFQTRELASLSWLELVVEIPMLKLYWHVTMRSERPSARQTGRVRRNIIDKQVRRVETGEEDVGNVQITTIDLMIRFHHRYERSSLSNCKIAAQHV